MNNTMPYLESIYFNLTKTCNLACKFCYDNSVRQRTNNLPLKTIHQIAQDAVELGTKSIAMAGGEPTSRSDWREIATLFDNQGIETILVTNGTLINKETATFLQTLKKCTISISLDGNEAIHDSLRGLKGAHKQTIKGLQALSEVELPFQLSSVICRENFQEIPLLIKLAKNFNCPINLIIFHPSGRGKNIEKLRLKPSDILKLREYCHILRQQGINIHIGLPPLLRYTSEILPMSGACGWAGNLCGILANGDVSVCGAVGDEPALVAGNVLKTSLKEIWINSPLFTKLRSLKTKNLQGICGRCLFNEFCGGGCRLSAFRTSGGNFLAPYELCQQFYEAGYLSEAALRKPSECKLG